MLTCENYLKGKLIRKQFIEVIKENQPLQLIHSKKCGPMNMRSRHGAHYFITFINKSTRYGYVYLIFNKSNPWLFFKRFVNLDKNQLDREIKTLKTNEQRKYLSNESKALCDEKRIEHHLKIPRRP